VKKTKLEEITREYQQNMQYEKVRHEKELKSLQQTFQNEVSNIELMNEILKEEDSSKAIQNYIAPAVANEKHQIESLSASLQKKERDLEEIIATKKLLEKDLNTLATIESECMNKTTALANQLKNCELTIGKIKEENDLLLKSLGFTHDDHLNLFVNELKQLIRELDSYLKKVPKLSESCFDFVHSVSVVINNVKLGSSKDEKAGAIRKIDSLQRLLAVSLL